MQELIQHTINSLEIETTIKMDIEGDVCNSRAEKALSLSLAFLYMQSYLLSCETSICNTAVSFTFY